MVLLARPTLFASAAILGCVGIAAPAYAQQTPDEVAIMQSYEPPTRRSGFTAGVALGMGYGTSLGYPNEADKLERPEFEVSTSGLGNSVDAWLGGSFTDWLTVGAGITTLGSSSGGKATSGGAALFHVDVYPLFFRPGTLGDLALSLDFGAGSLSTQDTNTKSELAMGGSMAFLGVGTYWQALHFGWFAAGPSVSYRYAFSQQTMTYQAGLLGFRLDYTGGPPKAPPARKPTPARTARR